VRTSRRISFAATLLALAPAHIESVERERFQPSRRDRAAAIHSDREVVNLGPLADAAAHLVQNPPSQHEETPGQKHHPDVDQVRKILHTGSGELSEMSQFVSPVTYEPSRETLEMSLSSDGRWNPWERSVLDLTGPEEREITGGGSFEPPLPKKWQDILQNIDGGTDHLEDELFPSIKAQRICIEGKLVPSLYLIGTQKAATTNFADKILQNASFVAKPHLGKNDKSIYYKELSVFNNEYRMKDLGKQGWLDYWPDCEDPFEFSMDATPGYLASANAPGSLVSWYGRLAKQITIVALLRNPLNRMHSAFYHMQTFLKPGTETFTDYVHRALFNAEKGCLSGREYESLSSLAACNEPDYVPIGDPFRLSLYTPELMNWLRYFPAKNFIISPWKLYVDPVPGQESLVHHVMSSRMNCTFVGDGLPMPNNYHNKLKDKRPDVADAVSLLMPGDEHKLKKLLAVLAGSRSMAMMLSPYMKKGLELFGYKGHAENIPAIAKHLQDHW